MSNKLTCVEHGRRVIVSRVELSNDVFVTSAVHRNAPRNSCDSEFFSIGDKTYTRTHIVNTTKG